METNQLSQSQGPSPQETFEPHGSPGIAEGASPAPSALPVAPTPPAPPAITPEMIQQAVQAGAQAAMRSQPQAPAPQHEPTAQEIQEFERQFNVVRLTPERFKQIFGFVPETPEQLKAAEGLMHDTARQAIAMATYQSNQAFELRLQELQQRYDAQLQPLQSAYQVQRIQQVEQEFITTHPDLKDHAALVKEVALATQAQLSQGQLQELRRADGSVDRAAATKFVADRARSLLVKAAPAGQPASRITGQSQRHSMTPLSSGGAPGQGSPPRSAASGQYISPKDVFGGEDSR